MDQHNAANKHDTVHPDRAYARKVRAYFDGEISLAELRSAAAALSKERWSLG